MTNEEFCEIMDNSNFMIDSSNLYDMKIFDILQRQIPKEPYNVSNKAGICPNCGSYVCFAWHEVACGDCGQLLDWS